MARSLPESSMAGERGGVMLAFLLFETRVGAWVLGLLERWAGLAVVPVEFNAAIVAREIVVELQDTTV